ncbi:hypothetical protein EGW08_000537 [Elysia chlorotica]|uniref:Uncharacterized protein n=1 Tax=Elysia chlorotica TaxID=188477 RepID=A0A3S1BU78_ELYCH|nr:hypothetical protein EGW08_000537 [Elysia chlorotica]
MGVSKPRGVVLQQQTSCYQRYILVLVGLGLGSLLVYIYYTDHMQHAVLPSIKAGVKRSLCSVMTLPCPELDPREAGRTRTRPALVSGRERTSTHRQRGGSVPRHSDAGQDEMGVSRRKSRIKDFNRNRDQVETSHTPALRVRPRNPVIGSPVNRGQGIGLIPTWKILQRIKDFTLGSRSEEEDSKRGEMLNGELTRTNENSREDDRIPKERTQTGKHLKNYERTQIDKHQRISSNSVAKGGTRSRSYAQRGEVLGEETGSNMNHRRQTTPAGDHHESDNTKFPQDGHMINTAGNLQGSQSIESPMPQRQGMAETASPKQPKGIVNGTQRRRGGNPSSHEGKGSNAASYQNGY